MSDTYFGVAGKYAIDASGNRAPAESWPSDVVAVSKILTIQKSQAAQASLSVEPAMPCCGNNTTSIGGGLTLGPELVTNGTFANGLTGWTNGSGWTASAGGAQCNYDTTPLSQAITFAPGGEYRVGYTVSDAGAGGYDQIRIGFSGGTAVNGAVRSGNGIYVETLTADTGNNTLVLTPQGDDFAGIVDNVSVQRIL